MQNQLNLLRAQMDVAAKTGNFFPSSPKRIKVNPPKEFTGKREETATFLAQCELVFRADPIAFEDDAHKLYYTVSYLRDSAFVWYQAAIADNPPSYKEFTLRLRSTFGEDFNLRKDKAYNDLERLSQTRSCQEYATQFIQLAARVNLNEETKIRMYERGLKEFLQVYVAGLVSPPEDLNHLMKLTINYNNVIFRLHKNSHSTSNPTHIALRLVTLLELLIGWVTKASKYLLLHL